MNTLPKDLQHIIQEYVTHIKKGCVLDELNNKINNYKCNKCNKEFFIFNWYECFFCGYKICMNCDYEFSHDDDYDYDNNYDNYNMSNGWNCSY